ncbi:MAG: hypothetical protein MUF42_09085 [Cytophagaceae bacterium]|nr:hypothetical protein [Cytophagaceae bacterium]
MKHKEFKLAERLQTKDQTPSEERLTAISIHASVPAKSFERDRLKERNFITIPSVSWWLVQVFVVFQVLESFRLYGV